MIETQSIGHEAQRSLYHILPRVEEILKAQIRKVCLG
jgi:hypothetical protein